jgi:hypothetical protein
MSTFDFLIPTNFNITQNAELYVMTAPSIDSRKYHWTINCNGTLNNLFTTRSYTENASNNTLYNVSLITNTTQIESWLTTTGLTYDTNGTAGGSVLGLEIPPSNFNLRLLEMVALEIFGHAKARAAIRNDGSSTFNFQNVVSSHLSTSFQNESIRNNFFEQYVQLNKISGQDVGSSVDFNLANTSIFVFGNFSGNIIDATNGTPTTNIFKTNYSTTMRIQFRGV